MAHPSERQDHMHVLKSKARLFLDMRASWNIAASTLLILLYAYIVYSIMSIIGYQNTAKATGVIVFYIGLVLYASIAFEGLPMIRSCTIRFLGTFGRFERGRAKAVSCGIAGVVLLIAALLPVLRHDLHLKYPTSFHRLFVFLPIAMMAIPVRILTYSEILQRVWWNKSSIHRHIVVVGFLIWLMIFWPLTFSSRLHEGMFDFTCGLLCGFILGELLLLLRGKHWAALRGIAHLNIPLKSGDALTEGQTISVFQRVKDAIYEGRAIKAWCIYLSGFYSRHEDQKEKIVAKCRLLYIAGFHRKILELTHKYQNFKSGRLTSLEALALRSLNKHGQAMAVIRDYPNWKANPFLLVNAGLLAFEKGDHQEALEYTRRALELHDNCPTGVNNLAYFQVEHIIASSPANAGRLNTVLGESEELILAAMKNARPVQYIAFLDTLAYCHLLSRDEIKVRQGAEALAAIMAWNPSAKYHLSLVTMINSRRYTHAEYLLHSVIFASQQTGSLDITGLASENLKRIEYLRSNNLVLNMEFILYHRCKAQKTPHHAIVSSPDPGNYIESVKKTFFKLSQLEAMNYLIKRPTALMEQELAAVTVTSKPQTPPSP